MHLHGECNSCLCEKLSVLSSDPTQFPPPPKRCNSGIMSGHTLIKLWLVWLVRVFQSTTWSCGLWTTVSLNYEPQLWTMKNNLNFENKVWVQWHLKTNEVHFKVWAFICMYTSSYTHLDQYELWFSFWAVEILFYMQSGLVNMWRWGVMGDHGSKFCLQSAHRH